MSARRWLVVGLGLVAAAAQASTTVVGVVSLDGDPRYAPRRVERAYPGHPMSRAAEGLRLGLADSEYELRTNGLAVEIKRVSVNDAADVPRALKELKAASKLFGSDALRCLDARRSLASRTAEGAPSPKRVAARLAFWRKRLAAKS